MKLPCTFSKEFQSSFLRERKMLNAKRIRRQTNQKNSYFYFAKEADTTLEHAVPTTIGFLTPENLGNAADKKLIGG